MEFFREFLERFWQFLFAMIGAAWAFLQPCFPFAVICILLILADCWSAWELSKRVKKKFPGQATGKFKSQEMGRVFMTMIKVFAAIVLAAMVQSIIFEDVDIKLPNIVAGAVCFWQVWSILENESSCNNAKWARIAQKIMIDKTERHFDIDLSDLKNPDDHYSPPSEHGGHHHHGEHFPHPNEAQPSDDDINDINIDEYGED